MHLYPELLQPIGPCLQDSEVVASVGQVVIHRYAVKAARIDSSAVDLYGGEIYLIARGGTFVPGIANAL